MRTPMENKEWTVKDLVEALKKFPLEAKVYYEMGPKETLIKSSLSTGSIDKVELSRLSWKWRKRSSVKIAERTYEKRAQALHC
jgi:uncharacterized protein YqgV (UPF0045/DUF77 family)